MRTLKPGVPLIAAEIRPGTDLLAEGRSLARIWTLGSNRFLAERNVGSEAEYKRREAAKGRVMQHAHIGFRSIHKTVDTMGYLFDTAQSQGVLIDRFGITLDWSMGYPPDRRGDAGRGTGIVLEGPDDFQRLTNASPAATHFGDFMLGLPGALHNVQSALAAGATAIGNLGQYFTFRLPYWEDDVATTEATVTALGLIAAQDDEVLVHSNLDDGFAGLFLDMTSAFGMMLIEKHIIEDLIGARASFCFGHHFSSPLRRAAFHAALAREVDTPGTMLFGNTVAYRGLPAANYASLASYLLTDICSLKTRHTGHAINPVPVTENQRTPDTDEILDAQCFAARLVEHADEHQGLIDRTVIEAIADKLVSGGRRFARAALDGLQDSGVDISDPAALMLAIRRLGARQMENLWGVQPSDDPARAAQVPADWAEELEEMAQEWLDALPPSDRDFGGLKVAIGTTDVHEHGALLVNRVLEGMNVEVVNAGVSIDAEDMVAFSQQEQADVIAISTYNGIALSYAETILARLRQEDLKIPVLIGGKLNQIRENSNAQLPTDVSKDLESIGVHPCADLDTMLDVLRAYRSRGLPR